MVSEDEVKRVVGVWKKQSEQLKDGAVLDGITTEPTITDAPSNTSGDLIPGEPQETQTTTNYCSKQ